MAANLDKAESSLTTVSDVAYIRAIDSSGNSVRISKADLASVLGGLAPTLLTSSSDLNNTINTGWKMYYSQNTDNPANIPSVQDCYNNIIWCYKQGAQLRYVQVLYSMNLQKYFIRAHITGTWYAWQEISVNIPTFYKNYSTLAELKAALANV